MKKSTLEIELNTIEQAIESDLRAVNPKRCKETRDLMTVLTVVSTVATLIETLLEIREKLTKQRTAPEITMRNANRDELRLREASEEQIRAFVTEAED